MDRSRDPVQSGAVSLAPAYTCICSHAKITKEHDRIYFLIMPSAVAVEVYLMIFITLHLLNPAN